MTENKRKVRELEKAIDATHPQVNEWVSVVLIDGKYYTPGLNSKTRRLLTEEELADLKRPGVGVITMKITDAPIPAENLTTEEVKDEEL